ncbi:MAG: hypothetical protein ACLR6J_12235 [Parabacteroides merdae]
MPSCHFRRARDLSASRSREDQIRLEGTPFTTFVLANGNHWVAQVTVTPDGSEPSTTAK